MIFNGRSGIKCATQYTSLTNKTKSNQENCLLVAITIIDPIGEFWNTPFDICVKFWRYGVYPPVLMYVITRKLASKWPSMSSTSSVVNNWTRSPEVDRLKTAEETMRSNLIEAVSEQEPRRPRNNGDLLFSRGSFGIPSQKKSRGIVWRCGVSIPVPLTC